MVPGKKKIVALGEVTGHYHELIGDDIVITGDPNGELTFSAPSGGKIAHQEHKTFSYPAQDYKREIVQEHDPFEDTVRDVID